MLPGGDEDDEGDEVGGVGDDLDGGVDEIGPEGFGEGSDGGGWF